MKRRRKLSIVTVTLAMTGAMFATAGIAAGDGPVFIDRGVLLLHTSDDGYKVQWYDAPVDLNNPPTATQTLTVDSKCNVSTPTLSPKLATLTPSGGNGDVGAVSHGLGVKTKNNCSTEQGQIALLQTLKVELGSTFNNTFSFSKAELDIEGKGNAKLGVAYSTGESESPIMLGNTSDNGPDSGAGDNNIVTLAPVTPFRSVTLYPVVGGNSGPAVSLEGGGDGTVVGGSLRTSLGTNASVFAIVQEFDGVLDCGESTPTETGEGVGNAAITVFRGGQANCELKPYNDDAFGATASFEPTGQADAEFTATIVWPVEGAILPVPVTDIDFGNGPEAVQWCTGSADRNLDGTLATNVNNVFTNPPELPLDASWCLLDQDVTYVNGDEMQVTEYYYGNGDPFFAR